MEFFRRRAVEGDGTKRRDASGTRTIAVFILEILWTLSLKRGCV